MRWQLSEARIAFVGQLDVDPDDLLVVSLQLVQLVGDVLTVVIGDLKIAALHNDLHACDLPTMMVLCGWLVGDPCGYPVPAGRSPHRRANGLPPVFDSAVLG